MTDETLVLFFFRLLGVGCALRVDILSRSKARSCLLGLNYFQPHYFDELSFDTELEAKTVFSNFLVPFSKHSRFFSEAV